MVVLRKGGVLKEPIRWGRPYSSSDSIATSVAQGAAMSFHPLSCFLRGTGAQGFNNLPVGPHGCIVQVAMVTRLFPVGAGDPKFHLRPQVFPALVKALMAGD